MMTKAVLLFGALAAAILLFLHWAAFDFFYASPFSVRPDESAFSGLGPAVWFWFGLLAVALICDYFVSQRDRHAVRPFATVLNSDRPEHDSVTQVSDGNVLSTSTSGSVNDRIATVTLRDPTGSKTGPILRVDVSCNCPWVLDIHRRSIAARLVGLAGAVVVTGDPALDAVVVIQADDEEAVRRWLREPPVRARVLSLFQQHKVESLSVRDGGSVLTAEIVMHNPLTQPKRDAAGITEALSALAETLEHR